jgi:hypothetical protein
VVTGVSRHDTDSLCHYHADIALYCRYNADDLGFVLGAFTATVISRILYGGREAGR